MRRLIIGLAIVLLCALIVAAVDFNPSGDIDLKGRYNIKNGGNLSISRLFLTSPPSACPSNQYLTYYNGTTGTCQAVSQITNNLNVSTKNVTVQCIKFDSGGSICSS